MQCEPLSKPIGVPWIKRGLMVSLLLLVPAGVASADSVTYTYTGQAFTHYTCLYNQFCAGPVGPGPITLSFTESTALPANLTGPIYGIMADLTLTGFTPTSFSISDGLNTIMGVSSAANFYVETDGSGKIIAWNIGFYNGYYAESTVNSTGATAGNPVVVGDGAANYYTPGCTNVNGCETYHYIYSSPGSWAETQTGANVPEPSSLVLFGIGMVTLGAFPLLRKRRGSSA